MSNQTASLLVSSSPSSSSSSTPQWKYDVFLSFRGDDTRNKFTDHLNIALKQRGFVVFKDDEELERGKVIAPELLKAIEESRCSIVVLSRNYASSTWCLNELVKIVECMSKSGQVVLPVFYDVDPSEVRKQTGSIQEAFAKHEEDFRENIQKVQEWRTVMIEVANVSGWNLKDGSEAKLIKVIVEEIWCKLSCTFPSDDDNLVGIDSRLRELNTYLGEELNGVRFIGICGMGGMGKTTIARVVYERLSHKFESSCFLLNVKEVSKKHGLVYLQNQLLSEVLKDPNIDVFNVYKGVGVIRSRLPYKKVLLILDDVDNSEQLKMLAGDPDWFGSGSRIFITTRNQQVLRAHGVDGIYEAKGLDNDESLTLFSRKAFKLLHPARDYEELSKRVVNYANGLPLALEVLGSLLYGNTIEIWEDALKRLNKFPNRDIHNILKISFDGLEEVEKKIFLDIACFFKGSLVDHETEILNACGFYSKYGIQVLIDKSLIKWVGNTLWMHDLLQVMGQEIVRHECTEEPGKRSRLWVDEDVNNVLTNNTGTNKTEAILIDLPKRTEEQWNVDSFSKMPKLRLLKIHNVHLYRGPKCLSNELLFLEWHGYPSEYLPFTFHPSKLVELNLCYSGIKQLWKEKEVLENLKFITLSHSQNLTKTPDFTGIPNLEMLILEGCTRLCEVHPSVGLLRKLNFLNLRNCKSLRSLPSNIQMESLEAFILSGCSILRKFPEITGKMELLSYLCLDGTAIQELPSSIEHLTGLVLLNLRDCKNLVSLSNNINSLKSLCTLNLSGCSKIKKFPEIIGKMELLSELHLDGTAIEELPSSIDQLSGLVLLDLRDCKKLVSLPSNINSLKSLPTLSLSGCSKFRNFPEIIDTMELLSELYLDGTAIEELPSSIEHLTGLVLLNLRDCKNLVSLPSSIYGLKSLKSLILSGCCKLQNLPKDLGQLKCLEELDVSGTALRQPPSSIFLLKKLKVLSFHGCKEPPSNSWFLSLPFLSMQKKNLEPMPLMLPSLSGSCSLTKLDLSDCNLGEGAIPNDIGCLSSLEELNLSSNNFVSLPTSINRLSQLWNLEVENCKRLRSLPELSLATLHVKANGCTSLEMLPDPLKQYIAESKLPSLSFDALNCFKLVDNQRGDSITTRMLKRYLQGAANLTRKFDIVIPGNKIPEWVSCQTEGNKVTIQISQLFNNKNKLIGFVMCSTFVVHQHSPLGSYHLDCVPHTNNGDFFPHDYIQFEDKLGQAVPDHLWLIYNPSADLVELFLEFEKASHFGFSISSNSGPSLEVKKCGLHPIFEQDVVELCQTMNKCNSFTFDNYNDLHQDFDEFALDDGAMIKRINDEAGPSGSDYFEDEPYPKRFNY